MCVNPLGTESVYFVIACHAQIIVAHFLGSDDVECFLSFALKLMHYWTQTIAMCHHKVANLDFGDWSITICCKHFLVRRHTIIKCYLVTRSGPRQNASTRHELEVSQGLVEALFPVFLQLLGLFHLGDASRYPGPELFRIELQRLAVGVFERVSIHKYFLTNPLQLGHARGILGASALLRGRRGRLLFHHETMAPSVLTYTTGATYHLCRGRIVPFNFEARFLSSATQYTL